MSMILLFLKSKQWDMSPNLRVITSEIDRLVNELDIVCNEVMLEDIKQQIHALVELINERMD